MSRVGGNRLQVFERASRAPAGTEPLTSELVGKKPRLDGDMLLKLVIRHGGTPIAKLTTPANPGSAEDLYSLLSEAMLRSGADPADIAEFEMEVREAGSGRLIMTFVVPRRPVSL